jgi:hypothetical protein
MTVTMKQQVQKPAASSIHSLSWSALNRLLLTCADEQILRQWLDDTAAAGRATRAMRIYGRLSAVRRTHELKILRRKLKC